MLFKNTCTLTTKAAGSYKTVVPINQLNDWPTDRQTDKQPTNKPTNQPTKQPSIHPSWITSCNFFHYALQYCCVSKLQHFQYSHLQTHFRSTCLLIQGLEQTHSCGKLWKNLVHTQATWRTIQDPCNV